ncbi:hypothetical protein JCM6882_005672 [Rhodosporidiobolus microsporus]
MNRRLSFTALERRKRNKSLDSDDSSQDAATRAEEQRKRVNLACATCRRRKIRCDGLKPACTNCSRQGRDECNYIAVSAEENQAVKERKQLAKLRREQQKDKEKGKERVDKPVADEGEKVVKVKRETKDAKVEPHRIDETQLSTRRRWNRTIRFDAQGARSVRSVASSNHSPALQTPSLASPGARSHVSLQPGPTPGGLTAATLAWHITTPNEPRTAPVGTASRSSYFDPAYAAQPSYPVSPYGDSVGSFASPPQVAYEVSPVSSRRELPSCASPVVQADPIPSPTSRASELPSPSNYPLTPPLEQVYLAPAPANSFHEEDHEPWYDAEPPPPPPPRHTQRPLNHSYSAPQLPQYSPNADWQLYHAIPSPVGGIAPSAISPGPKPTTALHPDYFPPTPADPPSMSLCAPRERRPTSLDFLPETLTPAPSHPPTSSLGLQFMDPVENVPLTLAPATQATMWAPSPSAVAEGDYGEAIKYASNPWTDAWVEDQSRQPQSHEPFDGLPMCAAIVCSSFLIGVLFTSLLWDATLLYGLTAPITEQAVEAVEAYYLTWWNGAMAVKIFLHVVMAILFLSLVAKWARKSDTAYYFTGASILMLILTASLYIVITLPSLRLIAKDPLNKALPVLAGEDFFTRVQAYFAARNSGTLGDRARENAEALRNLKPMSWGERVQHDQVLCAGNTLAMGLLVGVVLLQVSEWYLDETLVREAEQEYRKEQAAAAAPAPAAQTKPSKVTAEKKKQ